MDYRENIGGNRPQYSDQGQYNQFQPEYNDAQNYNHKALEKVLMVAEKPSIARTITNALSGGRYMSRKGESKYCTVYEFNGIMLGREFKICVTSVTGHVFSRDFDRKYSDWYKTDPFTLFDVDTIKRESNPHNRLIDHLKMEARGCSYLVLWLDNDREGENICFEILDLVKKDLRKKNHQQIFRAKFSSIAPKDILFAFQNIREEPDLNQSMAVEARQIIDLKVGVAFSRFQSLYLKKKFQNLNEKMITFGPCQTPTLGFCVERQEEILSFKPQKFYKISTKVAKSLEPLEVCNIYYEGPRINTEETAQKILSEINFIGGVEVTEISKKEGVRGKPEALNTVQLLKHASQSLNLGPKDAMHVAEKLYLGGLITYPRTETTAYSINFNFSDILMGFAQSYLPFSKYGEHLLNTGISDPKKGKDLGDHPPITPTEKIPMMNSLSVIQSKMYDFVCRHFLASISPNARFAKTKVEFKCGENKFHVNGSVVLEYGFTEIVPWVKLTDKLIPNFYKGNTYKLVEADVTESQTRPPELIAETELISLMEKNSIGTDASMATHISNIVERNYVEVVGKARRLKPTPLGLALIRGYKEIDHELVSPELRSNIEKNVDLIAKGKTDYKIVLNSVIDIFKQKFLFFKKNVEKMEKHFRRVYGTFPESLKRGIPFSKCGKCKNQMILVPDFHKIHCNNCKLTLNLPRDSKFSLCGENYCPLDGFQIVRYYLLRKNTETHLKVCPQCYHRSPYPDFASRVICHQCPNIDCQYSSVNTKVQKCGKCVKGNMILNEPIDGEFYITCNSRKCNNTISIIQSALEANTTGKLCVTCGATELKIKRLNKPEIETCVFCNPEFSHFIKPPDINSKLGIKTRRNFERNDKRFYKNNKDSNYGRKKRMNNRVKQYNEYQNTGGRRPFGSTDQGNRFKKFQGGGRNFNGNRRGGRGGGGMKIRYEGNDRGNSREFLKRKNYNRNFENRSNFRGRGGRGGYRRGDFDQNRRKYHQQTDLF